MRVSIPLTVGALVSFAAAQDLSKLPPCAKACVGTSLGTTGCQQLDIACICNSQPWIAGLSCCIANTCGPQEQETTIQFADTFCQVVGVTLPTSASCAASAGPTSVAPTSTDRTVVSTASASTPGTGGTSPSTTLSGVSASSSAASNTVSSGTSTVSATSGSSGSSTGTPVTAAASAASASPATAAANARGAELGLLGLAAALFAMV